MMPPGPSITLDQESFKALASGVRVEILKKLDDRRATVTDLSSLMDLSKPTLLEHLEKLQAAGLVKRVDEGRKWIYYELTGKGRKILHPEKVTIVVSLAFSALLAGVGIVALLLGALAAAGIYGFDTGPTTGTAYGAAPTLPHIPAPILAGFGLVAGALWFVAFAMYFRIWGDRRRVELFESLQDL